jgi:hypothetical protein
MSVCAVVVTASSGDKMSENVKDFIGMMIVTAMVIVFGTNLVTDNYNVWALMVQFAN